jgi:hypothetical protein
MKSPQPPFGKGGQGGFSSKKHAGMAPEGNDHFIVWSCTKEGTNVILLRWKKHTETGIERSEKEYRR